MFRVLGIPEYLFFKLVHAAGELEIDAQHRLCIDGLPDAVDFYLKTIDAMTEPIFDRSGVVFGSHLFANIRDIGSDRGESFINDFGERVDLLLK
jgi:hypothetical protein